MDLGRLTLHQLRVFRAVARHRSFTRAGEELGLTQPAVSAQIRALTELLGLPLVESLGKQVHLTGAGQVLLEHAERVEAAVQDLAEALEALRGGTRGRVRVGASTSIGTYLFPFLIAEFMSRHPGIRVDLAIQNSEAIQQGVLRGDVDVGYVGTAVADPRLKARPFLEEEIFFACAPAHPLAPRRRVSPAELAVHPVFVREPGSATRRTMEALCRQRGVVFPRMVQLGSVEAIKHCVIAGLGVAYFSELTVRSERASGMLVRLRIPDLQPRRTFFEIIHRDKRVLGPLERFTGFARRYAETARTGNPRPVSPRGARSAPGTEGS